MVLFIEDLKSVLDYSVAGTIYSFPIQGHALEFFKKSFPDLLFSNTPSHSTALVIYVVQVMQFRDFCSNNPLNLRKQSKEKKG